MKITLPKAPDEYFLVIDRTSLSFRWDTPRNFVQEAIYLASEMGIYVPFTYMDGKNSSFVFDWAFSVYRRSGKDLEAFDSLHAATLYYRSKSQDKVTDLLMFYAEKAVSLAREFPPSEKEGWKGLFKNFDYYLSANIIDRCFDLSIADVLDEMAGYEVEPKEFYSELCRLNNFRYPREFCNAVSLYLNLGKQVSVWDEYDALIRIVEKEIVESGAEMKTGLFEHDLLKLRFKEDSVQQERDRAYA